MDYTRRNFLSTLGLASTSLGISTLFPSTLQANNTAAAAPFTFKISLAEFSYASELYTNKMTNLDFPKRAVNNHGINDLEWVSGFFNDRHKDNAYMKELKGI